MIRYKTTKEAIAVAKELDYKSVIAYKQDDEGGLVILEISNTQIGDEMAPCYQVAQKNNCIAECVCNGKKYGGEINYCDL